MFAFVHKSVYSWTVTTSRNKFSSRYCRSEFFSYITDMPKKSQESIGTLEKNVTSVHIEVVGSGAPGIPPAAILRTNFGSYLLNCGEATLKLANEYRFKFRKTAVVFITYPSWRNISGLVGFTFAAGEANATQVTIHGHRDIGQIFSSMNKFIRLRNTEVAVKHCENSEEYKSDVLNVKYVSLSSSKPSTSSPVNFDKVHSSSSEELCGNGSSDSDSDFYPGKPKKFKSSKAETDVSKKNETRTSTRECMNNATSFIFNFKETPGKLIIEKCIELGVPPGPLLGQLKNGEVVTLDNGVVVRGVDVTEPPTPGVSVIAVECPSYDFLDSLLSQPIFREYQTSEKPASAVIHFSACDVVKHKKYQEWISRFPKSTLHLFVNEECKRASSVAIHRQQYQLNFLQPEVFPLLDDSEIPTYPRGKDTDIPEGHAIVPFASTNLPALDPSPIYADKLFFKCESNSFIKGETLCRVQLKPKNPNFDYSKSLVLKKDEFLKEMFETKECKEKLEECLLYIREEEKKLNRSKIYPKIVFLGTGSSRPSKIRNGSGILIFINESDCILFDCAESTFFQLVNFYGLKKAREILRNLHAIFISHMHIDHHFGLATILKERKIAFDEEINESKPSSSEGESSKKRFKKVFLLAPKQINMWLTLFSEKFEDISDLYEMISNSFWMLNADTKKKAEQMQNCMNVYNFKNLNTVPVRHCAQSFGISVTHKTGWKITYSGDTRPCDGLIALGRNSDILIHEATFENAFMDDAIAKKHSTIEEAIEVGKKMGAKHILLTHFSQRYCHLPNIECLLENENVGIAFDFMEVPYYILPLLPKLIKPLQFALSKYDEQNKIATEMFFLKKERGKHKLDVHDLQNSPIANKISKANC